MAPLDGITARAAATGSTVTYADGSDLAAAAATAAAADVAVVFGYYQEGEFADRPNISLDGGGDALIAAVAAANPNTVVVLQTGGPVVMPWIDAVDGVLEVWYAGEQMGPAIAALLWGDVAPSGKLTHSFPGRRRTCRRPATPSGTPARSPTGRWSARRATTEPRQVEYKEGLQVGYRWYAAQDIAPLFPFGHGLTYTTFAYDKLQVTPTTTNGRRELRIRFRVTNTGRRAGTETAQVYVELPRVRAANRRSGCSAGRRSRWRRAQSRDRPGHRSARPTSRDLHLLQYWDTHTGRWTTARAPTG